MSENFNVKSFGFNVIPREKFQNAGVKVEEAIGSLWSPFMDYLEKNENVFSGNVLDKIDKINAQNVELGSMFVGLETQHRLDTKG